VSSIDALMSQLRELNITLWVDGEQLGCRAPKGTLTAQLTKELSARKSDIVRYLQQAEALTATAGSSIKPVPRHQPLLLSFGQQRLWFLDRLEGPSPTYTMPLAFRLDGPVDANALQRALVEITARHEVLRTNFTVRDQHPIVQIHQTAEGFFTARALDEPLSSARAEQELAVQRLVQEEAQRCFDLSADRLLHVTLVRLSDSAHLLLLTLHHIVADGWSLGVFIRELASLYAAFSQGQPSPLPPLPLQYVDYAHWQRERLQGDFLASQLAYWRTQLAGVPEVLALPTDRPRPPIQTYRGCSLSELLDAGLTTRLYALSQTSGTTLFMTLAAGFAILLSRYSSQPDIVIGTPIANRNHPDLEGLIGLFINTLVLRFDLSGDLSMQDFLAQVRQTCLQAYDHQDVPFEQLVDELKPPRTLSHSPLIQVAFDLQNTPMDKVEMAGLTVRSLTQPAIASKFDLSLSIEETGAQLSALLTYNPDLFDEATIRRMMSHYQVLLAGIVAAPQSPLSHLPLLSEEERHHSVYAYNETKTTYPSEQTVLTLFEAWAGQVPDRVALSFADQSLTYGQLRQRVNQVAAYLQTVGVGPEVLVALCMERSLDMVIGLLGILKAGGAYIPLDPAYPQERLARVLEDARPAVILTQEYLESGLPRSAAQVICLDRDWPVISALDRGCVRPSLTPDNIAYVIYTSGSTGRPKGVQVNHRALLNFLVSMREEPGFTEQDVILAITTISFDIAALEIYLPLTVGAHLVVAGRETVRDGRQLQAVLQSRSVTCMQATPATWRVLVETGWEPLSPFTALCGGEALPVALAQQLLRKGVRLWNLYGPTETTIWSAVREVKDKESGDTDGRVTEGVEPIGHPINNTQLYIVDLHTQPLPIGIPGELYIGGDGLARGYLNQPTLTATSYVPDPFSTVSGSRLYRTGDLVRRVPDGRIDFLGRIDFQVKIRGYRIELGEIETGLSQQPGIKYAVVLAREDTPGDKRLVAYLLASDEPPPAIDQLRARLKDILPEYMVPAAFVFLDAMPLTPNGKVDRKALPAPDQGRPELHASFLAPRSELERTIADIWRQVLKVEHVGIDDNFFDLGGHSLRITQVHEALRTQVAQPLPLVTLFQYPTIRTLAGWLSQEEASAPIHLRPRARSISNQTQEIAIIGLAGRFPDADDLQTYWRNLREGRESIRFFSDQELLTAGVEPELISQPNYVRANGCLSDIASFDAAFFGFTPAEAEVMDPQHRLFLESAWHTLEHAGYGVTQNGTRIGVFAGCSHNGYLIHNLLPHLYLTEQPGIYQVILGNDKDFLPTRTSYALDLKGPSVNVQTACSTSLVAVHLACKSLLDGECEMALAGGVALKIPQVSGYVYQEGMIHSPDGHCRAFDANAQGTTWGSGVGIVLLKPLAAARADRDTIYAVIKGSAINNDGAVKVGFTAPGVQGQAEVIAEAQARAGVDPDSISYIEAHGTGTPMGDPIEIAALTRAFQEGTQQQQFCAVGTVKTNIGHLDTAAGIAGLCKTVLALQHQQIPPTLNFHHANPEIDFAHSPFYVNDQLRAWPVNGTPRRAGVSSFGIGGTNAHLIVEEAPAPEPSSSSRPCQLLIVSARSQTAESDMRSNLSAHLRNQPGLAIADVGYTLAVGRRQFAHRSAVVCRDGEDAVVALHASDRLRSGQVQKVGTEQTVIFMFPGQGAQYAGMGAELYRTEAVFRQQIDQCAELLQEELGLDLRQVLYPQPQDMAAATAQMAQTWLTQPALFVTEYALARLWIAWGVTPRAMIGHSLGEYVAACLAGVFDLKTALQLVARRGRLMWEQPQGAMLAVSLSAADVRPLLTDSVSIAAVNTPGECVVSGPTPALEALAARLEKDGVPCRFLQTSHAFHSAMMETVVTPFTKILENVQLNPPTLPFVSNLTGRWIRADEATDPHYWAQHLRCTVNFAAGIATILDQPNRLLLEVGPGTTLGGFARRQPLAKNGHTVLASLRRPDPKRHSDGRSGETWTLLDSLGQLWTAGVEVDWSAYYGHERLSRIPLPGYPFERQRYWIDAPDLATLTRQHNPHKKQPFEQWFYLPGWKPTLTPRAIGSEDFAGASRLWLVLSDNTELSQRTIAKLQHEGQEVITVFQSNRCERSGQTFWLRPLAPDDYEFMIQAIGERSIYKILHLWSLSVSDEQGPDYFARAQEGGYYSLLFLGRALAKQQSCPGTTIAVITNHVHDVNGLGEVCPEKATLLGPCLVMPQEMPQITCRCLDIVLPQQGRDVPASDVESLVGTVLAELEVGPGDPLVAYRGQRRLVPRFDRVTLDAEVSPVRRLRQQGVYVITGGLGNVSLRLARYLAETVQARIVLLGRSFFPAPSQWDPWLQCHPEHDELSCKIRLMREIEAMGAEVLLVRADVADEQEMRAAFAEVHDRFGVIHGVIHAAGSLDDSSYVTAFTDVGQNESQVQFTAKVHGLYVLEKLLQGHALDFCLVTSSNSAVLGGVGFTAYSAANSFIDAFVARQNRQGRTPWLSANWDAWPAEQPAQMSTATELSMTPVESVKTFQRLVSCVAAGRLIIATGDLQARFDYWVRRQGDLAGHRTPAPGADHVRPELTTTYAAPTGEVASQLAALWQQLLGFATVGIHDDFFELGGDSLMAIRLMAMIKERFGKRLPISVLLANPTIHHLVEVLEEPESAFAFSPLVTLQAKGTRQAFYCVPGTGGNVLYFHEFARCLAEYGHPFYGFQALGLDGHIPPLTRIEEIAAQNIHALQQGQPQGPYYLGGHSFGSWVALEMARQLQTNGHQVAIVAILDTGVPSVRDLSAMGGWNDTRWLIALADTLSRMYENPASLHYDDLAALTWTAQIEVLTRTMETLGIIQPGTDASEIRGFVEVYKTQAQIRYHPEPSPRVRVALFRAREPHADFLSGMPESVKNDETWGWQRYSDGQPIVEYVPGNHLTMMNQPHVRQLAERLHVVLSGI